MNGFLVEVLGIRSLMCILLGFGKGMACNHKRTLFLQEESVTMGESHAWIIEGSCSLCSLFLWE